MQNEKVSWGKVAFFMPLIWDNFVTKCQACSRVLKALIDKFLNVQHDYTSFSNRSGKIDQFGSFFRKYYFDRFNSFMKFFL